MNDILYVNAYAVTRNYGGSEEGGWWFNSGSPLASVPVKAERRDGCVPGLCKQCDEHRESSVGSFCTEEIEDHELETAFYDWLQGNEERNKFILAWKNQSEPGAEAILAPFYESYYYKELVKVVTYLTPVSSETVEQVKTSLLETLGAVKEGDIYSVLGGVDLEIRIEEEMAAFWPSERPRYE